MSFYLIPQVNTELHLEDKILSNTITDYVIKDDHVNISEDSDISDLTNFSDSETNKVNKFAELKYFGNKFTKSRTQEALNKIKVYILVKPVVKEGKTINVAVPINNFEDLGNTGYSRALTALSSAFLMRTAQDLAGIGLNEGSPGSRPFILEHAISVETPYETYEEVSLKGLSEGFYDRERVKEEKQEEKKRADQEIEVLEGLKEDERLGSTLGGEVLRSEVNREEDAMLDVDTQMLEAAFGFLYYYSSPYEYDYSFLDNTIFTNSRPYQAQPRDEENFNRRFIDFIKNIKNFDFQEQKNDLKVLLTESERILFKNTTELLSKNIIPVFCDLEEAENLLITVLEELTQPYRAIRPLETAQSTQKILSNIAESIDYIDDSLTLENYYFSDNERGTIDKIMEFLKKIRIIKAPLLSFSSDNYSPENYQLHGTKMSKSAYESWQLFFDEAEDLRQPYDYRKGPWDDTRCHLPKSDKKLLSIAADMKIISMGLGDFLEFWNNEDIKNGEVLFIPSLKTINKKRLPFINKKPVDRFYEYQKKFRGTLRTQPELNDYEYKITISPI